MTERLRIMIVDDEPLARLRLKTLLAQARVPNSVVAEAGDAAQALTLLSQPQGVDVDVLLLDIQMPGADGMRLAERIRQMPRVPAIVFVTAHVEHALRAFEVEAKDYLTKPVRLERLEAALARCTVRGEAHAAADAGTAVRGESVVVVHDRGKVLRIPADDILYLKAELKYVTLRTATHSHVLDQSLSELEQQLGASFVRVHRNALVARSAMMALARRADDEEGGETWAVQVRPTGEWLVVSRRQVAAVRDAIAAGA